MRKFEFKETKAAIEVEGRVYEFDPGDPDFLAAGEKAKKKLLSVNVKAAPETVVKALDRELRNAVGAMLGKDAQSEIFKGRKPDLINDVRLIGAIMAAAEEAYADDELEALLGRFGGETIDG